MTNYLPDGNNCTVLFADVYFKASGEPRFRHMGVVDSVSWTPEVDIAEKTWKGETVATQTTTKSATLDIVAGEITWANIKAAFMAAEKDLVQEAGTLSLSASNVSAGEMIDIGAYGVPDLVVSDGVNTLTEGVDYTYNPETNFVVMLTEHASVQIDGTVPAITAGERKVLSVLSEDSGISGEFRFVGVNERGQKMLFDGIKAELRPNGAVGISSDNNDFQTLSFTGKVIRNPANNQHPFGFITFI